MNKLPISALVVSHNEAFCLENCLKSINFCNEIMLIDLQSEDNSIKIAEKFNCRIILEQKVEMVEFLFPKYLPMLKNDWILLIDPDEKLDDCLIEDIKKFFIKLPNDCGKINVPIQYYYKNRVLKGTVWGGDKSGRLLVKKSFCIIGNNVHNAIQLKTGYETYRIKKTGNNVDHHYWINSFNQMLEKHLRYIKLEGKAKYDKGDRYNLLSASKYTLNAFWDCLFRYKGYKDGLLGIFLSLFYAWYIWSSWISLKKFQKLQKK